MNDNSPRRFTTHHFLLSGLNGHTTRSNRDSISHTSPVLVESSALHRASTEHAEGEFSALPVQGAAPHRHLMEVNQLFPFSPHASFSRFNPSPSALMRIIPAISPDVGLLALVLYSACQQLAACLSFLKRPQTHRSLLSRGGGIIHQLRFSPPTKFALRVLRRCPMESARLN
jgi:hypothetical protein